MDKERYIRRFETILANLKVVLYGRTPRGQLFNKELESFLFGIKQFSYFAQKHYLTIGLSQLHIDEFINSMENMEFEPHEDTAIALYDYCARTFNLYVEPAITSRVLQKHKNNFDFEEIHRVFQNLKDAYYQDYVEHTWPPLRYRSRGGKDADLYRKNKHMFVILTSFVYFSFFIVDDSQKIHLIIKCIFNHLDHLLLYNSDLTPNDIFARLGNLPKSFYEGFLYHFLQSGVISETLYYKLVLSIVTKDTVKFSTILYENNLDRNFSKYFELIELSDKLYAVLNERKFEPERFITLVSEYFESKTPESKKKGKASRGVCVPIVGVYDDIKEIVNIPQEIYHKLRVDKQQQFLLYERFCQIKFSHITIFTERAHPMSSVKTDNIYSSPEDAKVINQTEVYDVNEPNCKYPDKIDDFIDYLAWRGFIADAEKSSFKYDVFGGQKPSDYRAISFNFDPKISASSMLGVIVWQLRKENIDPIRLFNKKISLSNSYIGISKESQRIFVDLSLFFPSLYLTIRDTNIKEKNQIVEKNLKKRIQRLKDNEEYKSCSSVLEFIKKLEKENVQYWVVSTKALD